MPRDRATAGRNAPPRGPERDAGKSGRAEPNPRLLVLLVIVGLAIAYLLRFATGGETRREFYARLIRVYALIPDRLLAELLELWTDSRWQSAAIWDRWPIFLAASGILLASWSCGRLFLATRGAAGRLTSLELTLFSIAVGINFWATYVLVLGWIVGFGSPWLLRVPMVVVSLLGIACHVRGPRPGALSPRVHGTSSEQAWRPEWLLLALLPLVGFYILTAVLPPWEFDVREYHLQVPKEWFQAGRVTFLPHNVYGNMPLGAEMPALVAMLWMPGPLAWWWGSLVGKLMLSVMALLTGLAIYAFGRRYFHPWAGVVGAIVYLSTPWVFHVSTVGLVEGALGFYLFLALYALVLAGNREEFGEHALDESESGKTDDQRRATGGEPSGHLESSHSVEPFGSQYRSSGALSLYAVGGYLAGAAVACKYTGLVFVVFPLALLIGWQTLGGSLRQRVVPLTLFLVLMIAGCGVWFAKNLVFTGNPTYPLLYSVFGGEPWNEEKNTRWQEAHGAPRNAAGHRFSLAQLRAAMVDLAWYSDRLNPLMITLMLFCFLERRHRRLQILLVAFLVLNFATWWLLTHRYDRFFVPNFPVMAVLAGVGGAWWGRRPAYPLLIAFLLVGIVVNTLVVSSGVLTGDNRILVPLEVLHRDSWRSVRVHSAHRYLNQHVPPGNAALLVGEAQVFDLEVPIFYSTCWDDSFLELWMKGRTREERLEILKQHGISHVFVHWHEIDRYRSPGNYGFTDYVTRELLRDELVANQGILRPVPVPTDDGILDPESGELFEVVVEPRRD